ncbi:zinc-binding dehydrogenase [Shewanella psychropiezotolerans]|uniref:Zinc-binding dehydrogenase n=1 Tax=Shewanella psychropiezotolerans TaxID=2593655 RepID=A0ABX5X2Q0_9GAMM|nr:MULTISPECIES: zinc-binding dehydrogenase [Shewanella]MPY23482.1 zinc-binding dehydrogenase [Shewanella sp. YLB-07]QDO85559.1 zinc-binding dehydrogenase [Shewanella psychropiezotolerans]
MKAIIATQAGGPEVLEIREMSEPVTAQGEVKIRVKAFGLNKAETYYRNGAFGTINPEFSPGIEAAGVVLEDPSNTFRIGDKVVTAMGGMMFARHGGYAEIITVNKSNVQVINSDVDFVLLAALPQAYLTVWGALDRTLNIRTGETLLIRGATSSLGLAGLTYAKARGLSVIATTRQESNVERLKSLGADHVLIDDGEVSAAVRTLYPKGVDKALEVVGASTVIDTMKALRPWGEVTVVGLLGGAPVIESFGLMSDLPSSIKLSFFQSGMLGSEALPLNASPLNWIAEQVAQGSMPNITSEVFDFDDIRQAHTLMDENKAIGKIVVKTNSN